MATSAIDKELKHYVKQLDEPQKKSLLDMIKIFLKTNTEEVGPVTIEQYDQELMEAEAEYERGEYITNEEMKTQMKEWQRKVTG